MPRISTFYGIVIAMYYRDPPPHFHAVYGGHEATGVIDTLRVLSGYLPTRAVRLVRE